MTAEDLAEMYNSATAKYFKTREYDPRVVMAAASLFLYALGAADGAARRYDD